MYLGKGLNMWLKQSEEELNLFSQWQGRGKATPSKKKDQSNGNILHSQLQVSVEFCEAALFLCERCGHKTWSVLQKGAESCPVFTPDSSDFDLDSLKKF